MGGGAAAAEREVQEALRKAREEGRNDVLRVIEREIGFLTGGGLRETNIIVRVGMDIENYVKNLDVSSAQNREEARTLAGAAARVEADRLDNIHSLNIGVGNFLDNLRWFISQLVLGRDYTFRGGR